MTGRGGQSRGRLLAGVAMSAVGAAGFASKGVFAKFLYTDGWGVESLVMVRTFLALPLLVLWGLAVAGPRALARPTKAAMLAAAIAGGGTYYVGAMADFRALTMIDATVERVLLFTYPSMIVVMYALIYRRVPEWRVVGTLVLTYLGILMVVTALDLHVPTGNLQGAGLVLVAAFTSALYYLAGDRYTPSMGSIAFTLYGFIGAALALAVHAGVKGFRGATVWHARDLALLAGLVLAATVMPILALGEGVRRLGAQRAAIVSSVGPPTTILLGACLLGERLQPSQWAGVALIVLGIVALELRLRPAAASRAA